MNRLGIHSIRYKLFAAVLLTTTFALVLSGLAIILYDLRDYRDQLIEDLRTQSNLLGLANAPALQFNDPQSAAESLGLLKARPQILSAAIYNNKGSRFAIYTSPGYDAGGLPELSSPDGEHVQDDNLAFSQRIVDHGEILGTIYINASYRPYERVWQYTGIVCAVMLLALLISMLLSLWTQTTIARPILSVTRLAQKIVDEKDYSLRAEKTTRDEIGRLVDAFNDLLAEMGRRSSALESSNRELQQQITERREAGRALQQSEHRYRTLMTTITSAVWISNPEGEFDSVQRPWQDYTDQPPPAHLGFGWLDAFHADDRAVVEAAWAQACAQGRPLQIEARLWHAGSQDYHHVYLRAVPLFSDAGKLLEWIGTANDIDAQKRSALEIQRLNAELEQRVAARTVELERANKELEAFSYSVSHDLRTPLRGIDGFSQALLEDYSDKLDDTGRDFLKRVRSGAQRMGQLIDDLLKLSRVSRTTLLRENVDISTQASEIFQDLRNRDHGRDVSVHIAPGLTTIGDSQLLRIALENLLGNAWKYTGRREHAIIELGVELKDGERCYFVRDNGAGFNMDYADKLFGAFQRLHDAKEFAGTGIGLATVQRIVDRHGGRIWAEAQVDRGATFYFYLPTQPQQGENDELETDSAGGR